MKRRFACLLLCLSAAAAAEPRPYWICTDIDGRKFYSDDECPPVPQLVRTSAPAVQLTQEARPSARKKAPASPRPAAVAQPDYVIEPLKPTALVFWGLAFLGIAFVALQPAAAALARRRSAAVANAGRHARRVEPLLQALPPPAAPAGQWTLNLIQNLDPGRYAELCEGVWRFKGYRAMAAPAGARRAVDLYSPAHPDQLLAVIQCRCGVEPVVAGDLREFWKEAGRLGVKLAFHYSRSGYSAEARTFAAGRPLRLYGGPELLGQVNELPAGLRKTLREHLTRQG